MKKYYLFILILFFAFSCKKENITKNIDNVFIIKNASNSRGNFYIKYWKNNVENNITDSSSSNSNLSSTLFVDGEDIYIGGSEYNGVNTVAKYWKNGVPTILTNGNNDAYARSVIEKDGDVYVVGYEISPLITSTAKYWKNGIAKEVFLICHRYLCRRV